MIQYQIAPLPDGPVALCSGDEFQLRVDGKVVHAKEITSVGMITHWAYVDIPDIGCAYFVGNKHLEAFIIERFHDAERVQ